MLAWIFLFLITLVLGYLTLEVWMVHQRKRIHSAQLKRMAGNANDSEMILLRNLPKHSYRNLFAYLDFHYSNVKEFLGDVATSIAQTFNAIRESYKKKETPFIDWSDLVRFKDTEDVKISDEIARSVKESSIKAAEAADQREWRITTKYRALDTDKLRADAMCAFDPCEDLASSCCAFDGVVKTEGELMAEDKKEVKDDTDKRTTKQ